MYRLRSGLEEELNRQDAKGAKEEERHEKRKEPAILAEPSASFFSLLLLAVLASWRFI
jgi:hypothetical protein